MDHVFSKSSRQVHFNIAVADFDRDFHCAMRKLVEESALRGIYSGAWRPEIKTAMEKACEVVNKMLAFDDDHAALELERWRAGGDPTNPYNEEHEATVVDWLCGHASACGNGLVSASPRFAGLREHATCAATEVFGREAYRARREYGKRRALFEITTTARSEGDSPAVKPTRPKRSTNNGDARQTIISHLLLWHKYDQGEPNFEPIVGRKLAKLAHVVPGSVTNFFYKEFAENQKGQGYRKYKVACRAKNPLRAKLKEWSDGKPSRESRRRIRPDFGNQSRRVRDDEED